MDIPVSPVGFKVRMWNMVLAASCSVFTCYPQEPGLLVKIGGSFYKRTCFRKKKKNITFQKENGPKHKAKAIKEWWIVYSGQDKVQILRIYGTERWHYQVIVWRGWILMKAAFCSAFVFCKHLLTKFRMNTEWILVMLKDSLCHL